MKTLSTCPHVTAIGVNCTKPLFIPSLLEIIQSHKNNQQLVACYPNSGEIWTPEKKWQRGKDDIVQSPEYFANVVKSKYVDEGKADIVGGCCRIGVSFIAALVQKFREFKGTVHEIT